MAVAVVLSHADVAEELGHIGHWLDRAGYKVRRVHRETRPSFLEGDLLVSLGSPTSVAEGHVLAPAAGEVALVSDWVSAGRPFIGVCFGAQVLARALGGVVSRMPSTFRAYTEFETTAAAPAELGGRWSVWHEDAITAPVDAEVYATLPHADTVFRKGRAWGVQPHIEFDSDIVRRLVDKMDVKPGGWEPLYEALRDDDEGHARRVEGLLDRMQTSF